MTRPFVQLALLIAAAGAALAAATPAAASTAAGAQPAGAQAGIPATPPATGAVSGTATATVPPSAGAAPARPAGPEATGEARQKAEALFNRYIDFEHAFDPALVDLYAPGAHIESRIIVPGRAPVLRTWMGNQYKDLLKRALTKAKETKQDYNYYTAISYTREGVRVRIRASRFAQMQKAVSPVELLVGPDATGNWRIFEELSESHPLAGQPQPQH